MRLYNGIERPDFTPECIDYIRADEVFVFGSNLAGLHDGGASLVAKRRFGAIQHRGVGLQGQSFAIPTVRDDVDAIKPHVDAFITFARSRRDLFFYVIRIGCGSACFTDSDIAPLFAEALGEPNICLPKTFHDILVAQAKVKTEKEKMLAGEVYDAMDPELLEELRTCRELCWQYNQMNPSNEAECNAKIREILGHADEDTHINQPFRCDYGSNIRVGKRFFANFNLTILDEAPVNIGDNCFVGPNVSIFTACHSTNPEERNSRREWAEPVTIGHNCWIGGCVTILPGVTIGDNVTIGAGSVVVKDIPSGSIAVGNPAKVVKSVN